VPANGSVSIIFDATISAGAAPGLAITNVANVANPRGTGAAPGAMTTVAAPQLPAEGNKLLYIYNGTGPSTRVMTRTPQPAAGTAITINRNDFAEWRLQPALQKDLTIKAGSVVSVSLNVECVDTTWLIFWTVCASGSDLRWRRTFTPPEGPIWAPPGTARSTISPMHCGESTFHLLPPRRLPPARSCSCESPTLPAHTARCAWGNATGRA